MNNHHIQIAQLLCGIAYQTTSGLKIVSHILGALFSPGLVLIAAALLANKKLNLFFLPQFKSFYCFTEYKYINIKTIQSACNYKIKTYHAGKKQKGGCKKKPEQRSMWQVPRCHPVQDYHTVTSLK
jgi:hypothetical protein